MLQSNSLRLDIIFEGILVDLSFWATWNFFCSLRLANFRLGLKSPNLLQNLTWKGRLSLLMTVKVLLNWILGIYFGAIMIKHCIFMYFKINWHLLCRHWGVKRVNRVKTFPSQMVIRTSKYSQICDSAWEIRWCHPFPPYLNIWLILGHTRGQTEVKMVKDIYGD